MGSYKLIKNIPLAPFPVALFPKKRKTAEDWKAIISGTTKGGRNSNAASVFGKLMRAFPPSEWESSVWPAGQFINSRNDPPLPDEELRTTYESIAKTVQSSNTGSGAAVRYAGQTLEELYNQQFPEQEWLVDGLIPLGSLSMFSGEPKSFKSYLTQCLAMSIATGQPFLGKFAVTSGKVLIVDEENPPRITRARFNDMAMPPSKDIVLLPKKGVRMDQPKSVEALLRLVDEVKPRLIIIDSLTKMHSKNENQSNEMSDVFNEIKKLMRDDRAVVLIHHHRKAYGAEKRGDGQSIRGSSNIFAELDAHIAVDRNGARDVVITQGALRVAEEMKPFSASLTDQDGVRTFVYQGDVDDKKRDEQAILEIFTNADTELTVQECLDWTELSDKNVRQALKRLLERKALVLRSHKNKHFYKRAPLDEASGADQAEQTDQPA